MSIEFVGDYYSQSDDGQAHADPYGIIEELYSKGYFDQLARAIGNRWSLPHDNIGDLGQDLTEKALKDPESFDTGWRYAWSVANSHVSDQYRKRLRRTDGHTVDSANALLSQPGAQEAPLLNDVSNSVDYTERVVDRALVGGLVDGLNERDRSLITGIYFRSRTYLEVAAELGIPEGTVKSRVHEIIRQWRNQLSRQGIDSRGDF